MSARPPARAARMPYEHLAFDRGERSAHALVVLDSGMKKRNDDGVACSDDE